MLELTLELLRNKTGVFITESDYQVVMLDYLDWLKYKQLQDTHNNAEDFIKDWKEEQNILGTFIKTSDGIVKYYRIDGNDTPLTIKEYLEELDMISYHWENLCRSYWKIFHSIVDDNKVDEELIKSILSNDETVGHEQNYRQMQ